MKTPKTYRIDPETLKDIDEIKNFLQERIPYSMITETDVIHRAVYNYYYMLFGDKNTFMNHVKIERGE